MMSWLAASVPLWLALSGVVAIALLARFLGYASGYDDGLEAAGAAERLASLVEGTRALHPDPEDAPLPPFARDVAMAELDRECREDRHGGTVIDAAAASKSIRVRRKRT